MADRNDELQPSRLTPPEVVTGTRPEQARPVQVSEPLYVGGARNGSLNCRDGKCGGCPRCLAEEWPNEIDDDRDHDAEEDR